MNQLIQGSPDWFTARLGIVTASRVADIVARTKSGYSASRANYMAQLLAERLTGNVAESFSNAAMQWGVDHEPAAKAAYEFFNDADIETLGFVAHPTITMAGASPDGAVGLDGLVEVKCPLTATHIETRGAFAPASEPRSPLVASAGGSFAAATGATPIASVPPAEGRSPSVTPPIAQSATTPPQPASPALRHGDSR